MQTGREWPWILMVTLCACAALGVAAYSLASGSLEISLVAGALIALGAGIVFAQMRDSHRSLLMHRIAREHSKLAHDVATALRESRDSRRSHHEIAGQINGLFQQSEGLAQRLEEGLSELKASQQGFMHRVILSAGNHNTPIPEPRETARVQLGNRQTKTVSEPEAAPPARAGMAPIAKAGQSAAGIPFGDSLTLSLEPIVDLATHQTAHYRMIPGLRDTAGRDVMPEVFHHQVERSGQRWQLDCFMIAEAAGILESLRQRDAGISIFVPVAASTLCSFEALNQAVSVLRQHPVVAQGVIIEITHATLASLPEAGLEGMAYLARAGLGFSLAQSAISGVDLVALSRVNMRVLCFTGAAVGLETSLSAGLAGFVEAARASGIEVVVTHVSDRSRVAALSNAVRLACGPAFAAPRRLNRNNETAAAASALTVAA